jgi:hypothetical protein
MKGSASYSATLNPNLATVYKFAEAHVTSFVLNNLDNPKTSEKYTGRETCALYSSL